MEMYSARLGINQKKRKREKAFAARVNEQSHPFRADFTCGSYLFCVPAELQTDFVAQAAPTTSQCPRALCG